MKRVFNIGTLLLSSIFVLILFSVSCKKDEPVIPPDTKPDDYKPTPYTLKIPYGFPTQLNIPADNPLTVEGIELGRLLFYDGRLSGRTHPDSLMSCATCHKQKFAFECGFHPEGITGIKTPHVMLPLFNLVWNNNGYLWNGSIFNNNSNPLRRNLESLTWMGIVAPHEMYSDTNRVKALLQSIPMYPPLFKKAFGSDKITIANAGKAIAQFLRTLVSADSKFDRYLRGEAQLTTDELQGLILFMTEEGADCFHCHGGDGNPLMTTNLFYNNAKDSVFTDTRDRYAVTGNIKDKGAYRAPSLRNIALTGPYMHDGRFQTLQQVIDFYSEGLVASPYAHPLMHKLNQGGAQLTQSQKNKLIAFLKTLTDSSFITNPNYSNPRPDDPFFISD